MRRDERGNRQGSAGKKLFQNTLANHEIHETHEKYNYSFVCFVYFVVLSGFLDGFQVFRLERREEHSQ